MKKVLVAAVIGAVVALVIGMAFIAGGAGGTTTHPSYPLGHAKHCRVGYHKVNRKHWVTVAGHRVKRGYVDCVWTPPKLKLHVKLDPTFTQDALNLLDVTYTADASETSTIDGVTQDLPSLADGVLDLYSDGLLACSNPVGGSTTSATCEVVYGTYGEHQVIVEYLSGTNSATETASEDIENPNPIGTTGTTGPTGVVSPYPTTTTEMITETNCVQTTETIYGAGGLPRPINIDACSYTATATVTDTNDATVTDGTVSFENPYNGYVNCSSTPGVPCYFTVPDERGPSDLPPECPGITGTVQAIYSGTLADEASTSVATELLPDSLCSD